MSEEKRKLKREEYRTTIGPNLKKLLDQQKENVIKASYGCIKTSDYDAGEILAEKITKAGGIKVCNKNII